MYGPLSFRHWIFLATLLPTIFAPNAPAAAQTASWNLYNGLSTLYLPYANGNLRPSPAPAVYLTMNGYAAAGFTMDTGSTGIVVSSDGYNHGTDVALGSGKITYTSSGIVENGTFYMTDVVINSSKNTPVATAQVGVLLVTSITCLKNYGPPSCVATDTPTGIKYMGIGFDRQSGANPAPSFPNNPFTSLSSLASGAPVSSVRSGYEITTTGVYLGMNPANTQNFTFVKLMRNTQNPSAAGPQWNGAPVTVSAGGVIGQGSSLVDSGINYMFLTPATGSTLALGTAPSGTVVSLYLPGQSTPQPAFYTFTVGDGANLLQPASVSVVNNPGVFVNTGRSFLYGFSYLYDAVGGYVGYAWNGAAGSGYGQVTPALALQGGVNLPDGFNTNFPVLLSGGTTLAQAGFGVLSGNIAGSGGLTVTGGRVDLLGANTYTGGTLVAPSATLGIASDSGLGDPSGGLTLQGGTLAVLASFVSARGVTLGSAGGTIHTGGNALILSGPVTGGGLTQTGGGTLALNGATLLTGPLTVQQGLLSVNGNLSAPELVVSQLGTLRGVGSIAAPTVVFGTLAPGNSPGTLTIAAPVLQTAGSTLALDIDGSGTGTGAGNYSRLILQGAGNAYTIQPGAVLAPVLRNIGGSATNSYSPPLGQSFLVAQAAGGISGSFSSLAQPSDGLLAGSRLDTIYAATTLSLAVTPTSYAALAGLGFAQTANQVAIGGALDAMRPSAGAPMPGALAGLFNPLYLQGGAAIDATLNQLAPTIYADALMTGLGMNRLVAGTIFDALDADLGNRSDSVAMASLPSGMTAWAGALGQFNNVASGAAPGYDSSVAGTAAGVAYRPTPSTLLGMALAYSQSQIYNRAEANGTLSMVQANLYGGIQDGILFADAMAGGGGTDLTARRTIQITGLAASGSSSGWTIGTALRGGARIPLGASQIQLAASLAYDRFDQGAVVESATPASLNVASGSATSLRSLLAASIETRTVLGDGILLRPRATLGWGHEFADTAASTSAIFQAGQGAPFTVTNAHFGRDAAILGASMILDHLLEAPVSFYIGYTAALASGGTSQSLTGGFRLAW